VGICYWEARQLWEARQRGVSFDSTIVVGRQTLSLHSGEVRHFRLRGSETTRGKDDTLARYVFGDFADEFLKGYLGVRVLNILDASAYEGADVIHDMNVPIPATLCGQYDAVVESGSLEHIFNVPVALSNLMKLVRTGGTLFIGTPANNLCGHGFYQFSPELFYRVLCGDNGFEIRQMLMYEASSPSIELSRNRLAYTVVDPSEARERVLLMSGGPVSLVVEARKIRDEEPFRKFPVQSDYATLWQKEGRAWAPAVERPLRRIIHGSLPRSLLLWWNRARERRRASFANSRHYRRVPGS
jgi:SAM-dependent methyltransferase